MGVRKCPGTTQTHQYCSLLLRNLLRHCMRFQSVAKCIIETSSDEGIEVGSNHKKVPSRAKDYNRALKLRPAGIKEKSGLHAVVTDCDIVRRKTVGASTLSEIPGDDVSPVRGNGCIWLVKKACDLAATRPETGAVQSEEGSVTWGESNTERRLGLADGQFRGTARNNARRGARGAGEIWWMSCGQDWIDHHQCTTLEAWVIHGALVLGTASSLATTITCTIHVRPDTAAGMLPTYPSV